MKGKLVTTVGQQQAFGSTLKQPQCPQNMLFEVLIGGALLAVARCAVWFLGIDNCSARE